MSFLAILSHFVLVVDSMYRTYVRKIVVLSSVYIVRYFCYLMKKDRHTNLSKLSKTFAVYSNLEKQHGFEFMNKLSVILETKIKITMFLYLPQNSNYFTYIYSDVVEYYYFGMQAGDVQN